MANILVKVELPNDNDPDGQAHVTTRDGAVAMRVNVGFVSKRFLPGMRRGYFRATLGKDGILEIGDRFVPAAEETW